MTIAVKVCSRCGREKPLADFAPHPGRRDGRNSWCRPCAAEHRRQQYAASPFIRDRARLANDAYDAAQKRLRERFAADFAAFLAEEKKARGL